MTQYRAKALAQMLKKQFGGKIEFEDVTGKGQFRFTLTSKKFNGMPHLRRQDAIWETVDKTIPRELTFDITLILAYAPEDLALT